MRDLDLDVTRDRIKASSATLKLFTYLPQVTTTHNTLILLLRYVMHYCY